MREDFCRHIKFKVKCMTELNLYCPYKIKSFNFFNIMLRHISFDRLKKELMQLVTNVVTIKKLQELLHEKNSYLKNFKFALKSSPSPDCNIVIDAKGPQVIIPDVSIHSAINICINHLRRLSKT